MILYNSFDSDDLGENDMFSTEQALVSTQFYRKQGRYAGPSIDYSELQKETYNLSLYLNENKSIDVIYDVAYDSKVIFTFDVYDYACNQNNKVNYNKPADLLTNSYLFRLYFRSIKEVRDTRFARDDRMFHFELPPPIKIEYVPQLYLYFNTHNEIKDIVFMTDLMMDVFYGDNKYKLNKNKINDVKYLSKIKTIQDKLTAIEEDFKCL